MVVRWGADYIPNTKLCEETERNADTADFDIGGYERRNRNQHNGDTEVINRLISKKYVERGGKDGSWRVFVTQ